ncbi:MAG: AAA family ATPase, partial [Chloroflexi bacterium]|nr:AAA family ATPase [Chloroflexota bacterium]
KTEVARQLARTMGIEITRFDMSEYMERHTVSRLIGAPPGYVGYEEAGQLTEAIRRRPYAVVLFDEVEKAHHEVLNILLQVLDDGRLTDGQGRTVDFKNTVVIMTSNLGSEYLRGVPPEGEAGMRTLVMEALRAHFRPEFLNRVDETIIFHALRMEHMLQIIEVQLRRLRQRLAERKIELELAAAAKELVAREGFDPTYGARPLKRALQRLVLDPLAQRILRGELRDGDRVRVDVRGDALAFERAGEAAAVG